MRLTAFPEQNIYSLKYNKFHANFTLEIEVHFINESFRSLPQLFSQNIKLNWTERCIRTAPTFNWIAGRLRAEESRFPVLKALDCTGMWISRGSPPIFDAVSFLVVLLLRNSSDKLHAWEKRLKLIKL